MAMDHEFWQEEILAQSSSPDGRSSNKSYGYYKGIPCAQEFILPGDYPAHQLPRFCPILWTYIVPADPHIPPPPTIVPKPPALEIPPSPIPHAPEAPRESHQKSPQTATNPVKDFEFVQWPEETYKELVKQSIAKTERKHETDARRLQRAHNPYQNATGPQLKKRTFKK